ncbi:hypothetical protein DPEC_G00348480 [Dallia pectoralis]|uniref:Uncharacterized protein n=1 Tax=Dallia pectoralis TaxID=75939 RepID=A0ACC2F171_DALPE|nr:hypothetical protein DPEC_G00348480 [Dallia pectoralis]
MGEAEGRGGEEAGAPGDGAAWWSKAEGLGRRGHGSGSQIPKGWSRASDPSICLPLSVWGLRGQLVTTRISPLLPGGSQ